MKVILLNETQRQRIVHTVKPKKRDHMSYMNLNLLTAVCDDESGNVLTLTYFLSESIRRSGGLFDEYKFVLLTEHDSFSVNCIEHYSSTAKAEKWEIKNPCPSIISDQKLLEMIQHYENSYSERSEMTKQQIGAYYDEHFIERYLTENYFDPDEEAAVSNKDDSFSSDKNAAERSNLKSKIHVIPLFVLFLIHIFGILLGIGFILVLIYHLIRVL
ncbi:MAG: hypothetical protein K2J77_12675 [Oscillospiraceae bacterium]|nr:hypothetical protein [Oscillospiraceae bacterium]